MGKAHTSSVHLLPCFVVSLLVELRTGLLLLRMEGKGGWSFGRCGGRKEREKGSCVGGGMSG